MKEFVFLTCIRVIKKEEKIPLEFVFSQLPPEYAAVFLTVAAYSSSLAVLTVSR
jgi:hypothetical protein